MSVSFRALMASLFFGVISFCLILVYALHVGFVEKNTLGLIESHAASQTESIALLLQPDVMSGFYPAIVQRANRALELQPEIVGLRVEMRDGYVVFDKLKEGARPDRVYILERRILPSALAGQAPRQEDYIATVRAHFDLAPHAALMRSQRRTILAFGALLILLALGLSAAVSAALSRPIQRLAREMKRGDLERLKALSPKSAARILELRDLYDQTHLLARQNLDYRAELVVQAKEAALSEQARQVAHDIRSPLAALQAVSGEVADLPEEKRIMIRSAVGRIRDIANSLLERHRAAPSAEESVQLLTSLIEPVITEKRLQYRARAEAEIEAWFDAPSYGIFARVKGVEFGRLLSNLINNAVESLEGRAGRVRVALSSRDGRALLLVSDSGKGIAPGVLARLGRKGETHDKAGGSGLGLYHARRSVESWGGTLEISSEVGRGTTLTVSLPLARPPDWFVSRLELAPAGRVVVLDDDKSVHEVWRSRFEAVGARDHGVSVAHLSTAGELRDWVKAHPGPATYLVDQELLGSSETGLALIEALGLGRQAILVTSLFEEEAIVAACSRLGARLIPKSLAAFVPIAISPAASEETVLVDDDALVRATWKAAAKAAGRSLRVFEGAEEFLAAAGGLPKDAAIYVDSELGGTVKGEELAARLNAEGFTNLRLATGHAADSFAAMPWLKAVAGKEPPWG
jgi:signal transduction histidine kinase